MQPEGQSGAISHGAPKAMAHSLFSDIHCAGGFRFIDPTVQSSARAAEEPSRVTCRRGCDALGCVTAAPALQTRMMMMTN